jgi:mono/diheme cytochrome c family protein
MEDAAPAGPSRIPEPWSTVLRAGAAGGVGCLAVLLAACSHPMPSAAEGRSLYRENGCASCHGPSGHGDGPLVATLPSKPTDFRDASLFNRGADESSIAKTIAEGISGNVPAALHLHHTHHVLVMPGFDHLTELERRSIALYVISLREDPSQRANQGRSQP